MRNASCCAALAVLLASGCGGKADPRDDRPGLVKLTDPILKPSYPDRDFLDVDTRCVVVCRPGRDFDGRVLLTDRPNSEDMEIVHHVPLTTKVIVWEDPECLECEDHGGKHCPPHPDSRFRSVRVKVATGEFAGSVGYLTRENLRPGD